MTYQRPATMQAGIKYEPEVHITRSRSLMKITVEYLIIDTVM